MNLQFKTFCIWTDLVLYCQCYQHFILDRAEHSFNNKHSRIDSHLSDSICVTETWPRYLLTVDDSICVIETWSRYLLTVDDSICVIETWSRYLLTVDDSICVTETWSRYLLTVDDSICVTETWSRYLLTVDDSICVTETWSRYLLTVADSICVTETWSRYLLTVDDSICVAETVWFVYYRLVWCKMSVCGIATLFLSSSVLMLLAAILLYTIYSSCIHTYNAILSVYL